MDWKKIPMDYPDDVSEIEKLVGQYEICIRGKYITIKVYLSPGRPAPYIAVPSHNAKVGSNSPYPDFSDGNSEQEALNACIGKFSIHLKGLNDNEIEWVPFQNER